MILKKPRQYYAGNLWSYNPLWQFIGSEFIDWMCVSVGDDEYKAELYVEERNPSGGLDQKDIVEFTVSSSRLPLVVCGPGGIGKTTFLTHSTNVMREDPNCQIIWINVFSIVDPAELNNENLLIRVEEELSRSLEKIIAENRKKTEFWEFLLENWHDPKGLSGILLEEFKRKKEGKTQIFDQLKEILRSIPLLEHIRIRINFLKKVMNIFPLIIIDNADRLPGKFQGDLLRLTVALAEGTEARHFTGENKLNLSKSNCTKVIIAMRPESLAQAHGSSSSSTHSLTVGRLHPPVFDQVVEKRVVEFFNSLEKKVFRSSKIKTDIGAEINLLDLFSDKKSESDLQELGKMLIIKSTKMLAKNLIDPKKGYHLHSLTNESTRLALMMVGSYIASGHHEWRDIFYILSREDENKITQLLTGRKIFKALLLGTRSIFQSEDSWAINLFSDGNPDKSGVLIYLRLLKIFSEKHEANKYVAISQEEVSTIMNRLFNLDVKRVGKAIQKFCGCGLIEESDLGTFYLTRSGELYLKRLTKDFEYLQHVVIDCYINSKYLVECSEKDEHPKKRFWRVLRFAEWVREIEISEYCIVIQNHEEQMYEKYFGNDTASSVLVNALLAIADKLPDHNLWGYKGEKLISQAKDLRLKSSFEQISAVAEERMKEGL